MSRYSVIIGLLLLAGCAAEPTVAHHTARNSPEILTVKNDGTMVFRERTMNEDDVVIYDDGRGGERAAIRVYVPFMNDFYRDSIIVHREDNGSPEKEIRVQ